MGQLIGSGEFQQRSRLSAKALRLYVEQGLLVPARVDPVNRYRWFSTEQLADARQVAVLRGLGMPLAGIRDLLALDAPARAAAVREWWAGREAEHLAQRHLQRYLVSIIQPPEETTMDIRTTTTPARTSLSERATVSPEQLPGFIADAGRRLAALVEHHGGWAGPLAAIYRSPVTTDTDGEVEVAAPVAGPLPVGGFAPPTRVLHEPAREAAVVRLTRAQLRFPQVLQPYDELYAWVQRHGHTPADAPREEYLADVSSAAADEEVCDVVLPFTRG